MSETFSPNGRKRADNSRQEPGDLGQALTLLVGWGREARAREFASKLREAIQRGDLAAVDALLREYDTINDANVSEEKNDERQE